MRIKQITPYLLLLAILVCAAWQATLISAAMEDTQTIATDIDALQSHQAALLKKVDTKPLLIIYEPPEPTCELLTPCGLTAQELESGLLDGLKDYADDFMQAEQETSVNAVFLAAVAALESGWASSDVAQKRHNLFGWTDSDGYMPFVSKEECIAYVSGSIKKLYLSPDGSYFNGYDIESVNIRYNGIPEWAEEVRQIMSEILERSIL